MTTSFHLRLDPFLLLKSFFLEIFYLFICILTYPFFWLPRDPTPPFTQSNNMPILLIHGYLHNRSAWLWFSFKLKQAGFTSVYTLNLFPPYASIQSLAEIVSKKVADIKIKTGKRHITLIGHSMGGIIASYYNEYLSKSKDDISNIILLGSPVRGTRLACWKIGKDSADIRSTSVFLKKLCERMNSSSKTHYYYIGSKLDNIIIPWQCAFPSKKIQFSKQAYIVEDAGHLTLLYSSKVINKVENWLKESSFIF
jgi:triacylglycerol lipase